MSTFLQVLRESTVEIVETDLVASFLVNTFNDLLEHFMLVLRFGLGTLI